MVNAKKNVDKAREYIKKLANDGKLSKKNAFYILDHDQQIKADNLSFNRRRKYLYSMGKIARMVGKDFDKVTKKDVRDLTGEIREKYKGETPRDYLVMFRRMMRHVYILKGESLKHDEFPDVVEDVKPGSNKKGSKRKLPKDLLTIDKVTTLADNTLNLRDRAIIMTLYESGARIGELLLLKVGDVSFEKEFARISIPFEGKTGSRSVLVHACAPSISQWLQDHPNRTNRNAPLFCGIWSKKKGDQLNYPTVRKMLRETFKRADIDKPSNPHQFRHSRATELAKFMTEAQLCNYMGWKIGSKEAATYVHLSGRDTDKAVKKMYGYKVEEEEENHLKPIKCPRCGHVNDASNKFCGKCTLALDDKSLMEFDKQKEEAADIGLVLKKAKGNEEIKEMLRPILEDLLRESDQKGK